MQAITSYTLYTIIYFSVEQERVITICILLAS